MEKSKVVDFRHAIWPTGTKFIVEEYIMEENSRDDYLVCKVSKEDNLIVEILSRDVLNTFMDMDTYTTVRYPEKTPGKLTLPSEIMIVGSSTPLLGSNREPLYPYEAYTGFYEYGCKHMTRREYYLMITGPQIAGHTLPPRQEYKVDVKF